MYMRFLKRDSPTLDYRLKPLVCQLNELTLAGYSITGDTSEQALFICYGVVCNGKSVFLEVLRTILNDYAATVPIEALLSRKEGNSGSNEIAALRGVGMAIASEGDSGRRLQTGLIKHLTGNETIRARFLYQESFEFRPQCKLWVMTNHKPDIGRLY
jgi:putative DNA primase/helicase